MQIENVLQRMTFLFLTSCRFSGKIIYVFFALFSVLFFVLKRNRFALVKIPSFFSFSFTRIWQAHYQTMARNFC